MRYSVEHQRNIAYDLLYFRRKEIDISEYFEKNEPVIIYGFDFIGKEIYHAIKKQVNVLFILDREHDNECYDNTAIYSLDNECINYITDKYGKIKLIISILSDEKNILRDTKNRINNIEYTSIYTVLAECRIKKDNEFRELKNKRTLSLLENILQNRKTELKYIVLVGTAYTELLSLLYLGDVKNTLFIMERYIAPEVNETMVQMNMYCLYEKTPVEYYDLTYVIADYARRYNIPVYGHDHMRLSRAFINNKIKVIEDGLANYDFKYSQNYNCYLDNGRQYFPFGYDEMVEKVVLTEQFDIPEQLLKKVEIIQPSKLWDELSYEKKIFMANIFDFPYEEVRERIKNKKCIILLTEPTISDGEKIKSCDEQIKMYRSILSNYSSSNIMIKPHPADIIDYSVYFKDKFILNRYFPIQMLDWFGLPVDRYIVMKESSCCNIFKGKYNVDIYDGEKLIGE